MKYARIVENVAVEIFQAPEGVAIEECFHPDIAAQFVSVSDEVVSNSTLNPDGTWAIYAEPEEPTPPETPQEAPNVVE
jgi:hypothetical protein